MSDYLQSKDIPTKCPWMNLIGKRSNLALVEMWEQTMLRWPLSHDYVETIVTWQLHTTNVVA